MAEENNIDDIQQFLFGNKELHDFYAKYGLFFNDETYKLLNSLYDQNTGGFTFNKDVVSQMENTFKLLPFDVQSKAPTSLTDEMRDSIKKNPLTFDNERPWQLKVRDFARRSIPAATSIFANTIAKGKTHKVGEALKSAGNIASMLPGWWGAAASGILNTAGGIVNAGLGYTLNDGAIANASTQINLANNRQFNASNTTDLINQNNFGLINSVDGKLGEDGWWTNTVKNKENAFNTSIGDANRRILSNYNMAANNLDKRNDARMLANYNAYGGPLTMKYSGTMSPFGNRFDNGGSTENPNTSVFRHPMFEDMSIFEAALANSIRQFSYNDHKDRVIKDKDIVEDFAKDYNYRWEKMHGEEHPSIYEGNKIMGVRPESELERHINYNPRNTAKAWYDPYTMQIGFIKGKPGTPTEAHELSHHLRATQDKFITEEDYALRDNNSYKGTPIELDLLEKAYPVFSDDPRISQHVIENPNAERLAINTGFRELIAQKYNARMEDLDKVIESLSDKDLLEAYKELGTGYLPEIDIHRMKELAPHIKKALIRVAQNEVPLLDNPPVYMDPIVQAATLQGLNILAQGGGMGLNDSTMSNGLIKVNAGGTHEENPIGGVPMGEDSEGTPNLVEEGEVIFNDYVFSNRLKVPKAIRTKYKLRGGKDITFADAAKQLSKESEERPNDPISKAGLNKSMETLQLEQEKVKQLEEAKENMLNGMQSIVGNKFATGGGLADDTPDRRKNYNTFTDWYSSMYPNQPIPSQQEFNSYNDDNLFIKLYMSDFINKDNKIEKEAIVNGKKGSKYILKVYNSDGKLINTINDSKNIEKFYRDNKLIGEETPFSAVHPSYTKKGKNDNLQNIYEYTYNPITRHAIVDDLGNTIYFDTKENLPKGYTSPAKRFYDGINTETLYYEQPEIKTKQVKSKNKKNFKLDNTLLRYAPIVTSGISTLTDALGWTNTPDYSGADAIMRNISNMGYTPIAANYLNNYMTYNPLDVNYQANKLNAEAAAVRHALVNQSAGNRASAMAGLLTAGYNAQTNMGELLRQANAANLEQKQKVEEFNRATNQYNEEQALKAASANQAAYAAYRDELLKATMAASELRNNIDKEVAATRSANLTNFAQSMANLGNEEVAWNQMKWATEKGVFGPMADYISRNYKTHSKDKKNGGKLLTKKKYGI